MRQVHSWKALRCALTAAVALVGLTVIQVTTVRSSTAESAPPCQARSIELARGQENGAGGTETIPFTIRYSREGTCVLNGYATLQFFDATGKPIQLSVYTKNLAIYKFRHPKAVTLSRSRPTTFGIELTQNLNQRDHSATCISPYATIKLPTKTRGEEPVFLLKWPTGKILWNYAVDWCFAGWKYGQTPIEAGASPSIAL